jgi:hypothetical protein
MKLLPPHQLYNVRRRSLNHIGHTIQGKERSLQPNCLAAQKSMNDRLNIWRQQRCPVFGRPDNVVKKLTVGHSIFLTLRPVNGAWLNKTHQPASPGAAWQLGNYEV